MIANRPQLSGEVTRFVRTGIYEGRYRANEFIRLDHLAAELGISVTPVREAMFRLLSEGLIAQLPRKGFMVRPVTAEDILDVLGVQSFIGGELAARAAVNFDDEGLAALRASQESFEAAFLANESARTAELNYEFHRLINIAAAAPRLARLMSITSRYSPESMFPLVEGWTERSIADHRRVLVAMEQRDSGSARDVMSRHFSEGAEGLIAQLRRVGVILDEAKVGEPSPV